MHQKKVSIWTPFTQLSINPFQFNIYFQYYQKTSENKRTLSGISEKEHWPKTVKINRN